MQFVCVQSAWGLDMFGLSHFELRVKANCSVDTCILQRAEMYAQMKIEDALGPGAKLQW